MSYDILYRKAFIKVSDSSVIPVYESGSNNCYEVTGRGSGRERRTRDWHNDTFHTKGKFIINNDDLLKSLDESRLIVIEQYPEYTDDKFGWFTAISVNGKHTSATTFGNYRGFYSNGIKKAKTIEEYLTYNVKFGLCAYKYEFDKYTNETGVIKKPDVIFESTEHMLNCISEYTEFYKGTDVHLYIRLFNDWAFDSMERDLKPIRVKQTKVDLKANYYAIRILKNGCFFAKFTKNGFKYSFFISPHIKKFANKKQADAFHLKMRGSERFEVVHIP